MEHHPFEHIRIEGYRRLANVNLALKPLNVVIGGNGSGKTSLLEVMSLLSASAAGKLSDAFSALGGYNAVRTNLSAWTSQAIDFSLRQPTRTAMPLEYEMYIRPKGVDYSINEESLFQDRGQANPFTHLTSSGGNVQYFDSVREQKLVRPTWEMNPSESALSQVPRMFAEPEQFRRDLASSTHYHVLNVSPQSPVRLPQPMRTATLPGKDGEDLVSCLYMIREILARPTMADGSNRRPIMKIVILVEGETELAFKQILREFLTRSPTGSKRYFALANAGSTTQRSGTHPAYCEGRI